jgi:hypothetical protein
MGIIAIKRRVGGTALRVVKRAVVWILSTSRWDDSGIWFDEDYWRD